MSNRILSEKDFTEVVRKSVYKKKYQSLEKYLDLEQGDFFSQNFEQFYSARMHCRLDACLKMSNWIDTVQIDYWEEGRCLRRLGIVGAQIETIIKEDKVSRQMVKEGKIYDWLCSSSNLDYFVSVDSQQIMQIQTFLKNKKWYSGKVNGQWDKDLFKAIRFYDTFIIHSGFYGVFVELPQAVEQNVLYHMGIVKGTAPRAGMIKKGFWTRVKKVLLEKGYDIKDLNDEMSSTDYDALRQFQEDNGLKKRLDLETMNALEIKY